MNFEQLKIFLSVVDHRSFTKAAEAMYISHSTTSRNVSSLEESLDVRLLVRDNRTVRLTPAGEILYREGGKLLKKIDAIEGAIKNAGMGVAGKLSVASVNLYSYEIYSGYKDFCKKYPEVMLGIYHRDLPEVWTQVRSGEADAGITFSYSLPDDLEGLEICKITSERFCVVTPLDHPLALHKSVKMEDLKRASYISLPAASYDLAGRVGGKSPLTAAEREASVVPTLESLFLQIRSGNGISMVPCPIANEYGSSCAILDIEDMDTSFDVVMIWRSDNLNPSLPLLVEAMVPYIN